MPLLHMPLMLLCVTLMTASLPTSSLSVSSRTMTMSSRPLASYTLLKKSNLVLRFTARITAAFSSSLPGDQNIHRDIYMHVMSVAISIIQARQIQLYVLLIQPELMIDSKYSDCTRWNTVYGNVHVHRN
jgi:hypothetical protein